MVIDLASGLFALGGVALAGVLSELRAAREGRARDRAEIQTARRIVYTQALRRVEAVARAVALWVNARPEGTDRTADAVWAALTAAYEVQHEVRLIARDPETADVMGRMLALYRAVVESGERVLPKAGVQGQALNIALRSDLGLSNG